MKCATCGYLRDVHEVGTLKCPPEMADKNGRRGTFREPPPVDYSDYRAIMRRDAERRRAEIAPARASAIPSPQVPARRPYGPTEVASGQGRQALGLGRAAVARGWRVEASYWRAHDGTEGCAVKLRKDDLYGVATWARAAGKIGTRAGWSADIAYAWRLDGKSMPVKVNHTQLWEML